MKVLRWLGAGLVWILAGLVGLVGGLLCVTILLLLLVRMCNLQRVAPMYAVALIGALAAFFAASAQFGYLLTGPSDAGVFGLLYKATAITESGVGTIGPFFSQLLVHDHFSAFFRMGLGLFLVFVVVLTSVSGIPDSAFKPGGGPVTEGIMSATKPLKPQLAAIGYKPSDIRFLALSHYHSDHTANANDFAGATWIVQKAERDFMFADKPQGIIQPAQYSALKNAKTRVLNNEDLDVFGDGTVMIMSTPGTRRATRCFS